MNPTRISELPKELRELAEQRRSEMPIGKKDEDILAKAFLYSQTPEKRAFWVEVENRNYEKVKAVEILLERIEKEGVYKLDAGGKAKYNDLKAWFEKTAKKLRYI